MDNVNGDKILDEFNKRTSNKKPDEFVTSSKKKSSATISAEKRRNVPTKSPPNPFMSRLNISSFLDLMMSDKNDQTYSKSRKNATGNNFPLYVNSVKPPKDGFQLLNNQTANFSADNSTVNGTNSCPVCENDVLDLLMDSFTNCSHSACISCWQSYVVNRIESYEIGYGFTCLTCAMELPYHNIIGILKLINDAEYSKKLLLRLENFYFDRALLQDTSIRWCPNPGCEFGFSLIQDFSDCPKLSKCQLRPTCNGQLCHNQCVDFWKNVANHNCVRQSQIPNSNCPSKDLRNSKSDIDSMSFHNINTAVPEETKKSDRRRNFWLQCFPWRRARHRKEAKDYKMKRKPGHGNDNSPTKSPINPLEVDEIASLASIKTSSSRTKFHQSNDQIQSEGEVKTCPKCHTYVLKMNDGSCNHMVCVVCGCEFCWLCMRQITDMHYLSPSGCTFWGRRQWNVEKRALWQLGTLIGAPVAIGFLAALAIPAMVIGIPLYVGRKIHGALKTKNKDRKRTIAVAGGIGAFIVSPVIAAVAVGLGVPLILAYVYVVMPIALCRASACSCDENIPPQDEVDFSDVTNSQHQELHAIPEETAQSLIRGDIEAAVITRLPFETDHVIVSQSNSANDVAQTPIQRIRRSFPFNVRNKSSKSPKRGDMCDSVSVSHLRECGSRSADTERARYSYPLGMSSSPSPSPLSSSLIDDLSPSFH